MATVIVDQTPFRQSRTPPPLSPSLKLDASARSLPAPVPNKHLPSCPTGPAPSLRPCLTPPSSPPSPTGPQTSSVLYPPTAFFKIDDSLPIYVINSTTLATALDHIARQPLPDPKFVFPWLHGLNRENHAQLSFFLGGRKPLQKTPTCLRGITLVKCGSNLEKAKLKGAITPEEILTMSGDKGSFVLADPKEGFSVRNFQIQTIKMATVSDIVVYGDDDIHQENLFYLAKRFAEAQHTCRVNSDLSVPTTFNTFIVSSPFKEFEEKYPELVAIDSRGMWTGRVVDLTHWERSEMRNMCKASQIAQNVWQGPTPIENFSCPAISKNGVEDFDILIEASDTAQMPDAWLLDAIAFESANTPRSITFPSSGNVLPQRWSQAEADGLLRMCRWMHHLANPLPVRIQDEDGDIDMSSPPTRPRKILIHCTDGYTESSLLVLTYLMYAAGISAHEAWIRLHRELGRNFFAYPSDLALLKSIQPRILSESPAAYSLFDPAKQMDEPTWFSKMDGSIPSRILPYMYLGNISHANNPGLLKKLNITRILSIGEFISWPEAERKRWPQSSFLSLQNIQDNGVDPLTAQFVQCLQFIEQSKLDHTATLVHCRVGVSRSATICVAEVMSSLGISFPRAYCFVRARRLNVIIQPHLRFAYELLKWEEHLKLQKGEGVHRELEWAQCCREIAELNRPYTRC